MKFDREIGIRLHHDRRKAVHPHVSYGMNKPKLAASRGADVMSYTHFGVISLSLAKRRRFPFLELSTTQNALFKAIISGMGCTATVPCYKQSR